MVRSYGVAPERVLDLYGGQSFTIRDVVYDSGIMKAKEENLPYIVFSKNHMKAYMYFNADEAEKVAELKKLSPVTVSGNLAAFGDDTMYLYYCRLGY